MQKIERLENIDTGFPEISESTHPPGFKNAYHVQDFFELTYIVGGRGHYEVLTDKDEVRKIPAEPETVYLWKGSTPHRVMDQPRNPLHQIMINFMPAYVSSFSMMPQLQEIFRKTDPIVIRELSPVFHIKSMLRKIMTEQRQQNPGFKDLIYGYLTNILVEITRCSDEERERDDRMDERIRHALQYIKANYYESPGLPVCAKSCGLSVRHFSELFRKNTGKTFINFLNEYKINMVKEMLETTDKKIATIAFETGFDNLSVFNRTFKNICGMTPQQYRENK